MTDLQVGLTAAMCAAAAFAGVAAPWWSIALVALLTAARRSALGFTLVLVLAVSALSAGARAGLATGPAGPVDGWVTLVTDPAPGRFGRTATARLDGRLVLLRAPVGAASGRLADAVAGEQVRISGRAERVRSPSGRELARHLASVVSVESVESRRGAAWLWAGGNAVRRLLVEGASGLDHDERALLTGLVIGDDRDQSVLQRHAFRAAGLSHLLAVSGQNVAFVLVVVGPLTGRLLLRARFVVTVAVLGWFAVMTRLEPSVLRAVAMACVAAATVFLGRHVTVRRVLGVSVIGILVVDPLVAYSVGFVLSVSATAGLVLLTGPLTRMLSERLGARIPLGSPVAGALAVTLSASAATAPLVAWYFDVVPSATLVANLAAVPVAGLVMVWGMTAGLLAGAVPPVRGLVHLPTRVMLWWLDGVASFGSHPAWPRLTGVGVVVLLTGASLAALVGTLGGRPGLHRRPGVLRPRPLRRVIASVSLVSCAVFGIATPPEGVTRLTRGAELRRSGATEVLALSPGVDAADLLDALDRVGAGVPDSIEVLRSGRSVTRVVEILRLRYGEVRVVAR